MPRVAALVPMGAHSERVPMKNMRLLAGRPLFHHILGSLARVPLFDEVCVDTDSRGIGKGAEKGFGVRYIERPEHLRGGHISMNEILLHDVSVVQADVYLQTHATNPFLQPETINSALERFLAEGDFDSLFSVTRLYKRFWDAEGRPVNHDPTKLLRTQDLTPFFEENSCIYIFTAKILRERRTRIGRTPFLFEMDAWEAFDIDTESDFRLAELIALGHFTCRP